MGTTAFIWELTGIYSAIILHGSSVVTVPEPRINALIKAAVVNIEPCRPGLCAKALAEVKIGHPTYWVGVVDLLHQEVLLPSTPPPQPCTTAVHGEEKVEAKKKNLKSPMMMCTLVCLAKALP
ncbi:60S acidic ribosomal protein P1 [Vulpes lagopus]